MLGVQWQRMDCKEKKWRVLADHLYCFVLYDLILHSYINTLMILLCYNGSFLSSSTGLTVFVDDLVGFRTKYVSTWPKFRTENLWHVPLSVFTSRRTVVYFWQSNFEVSCQPISKEKLAQHLQLPKVLSCLYCSRCSQGKKFCISLPVFHHDGPEKKHCSAELPTPTNTGLPLCQMNFRIPVQGMLFGRKLGSHWLSGAVQLFCSFVRSCSSFSKMLPSASLLRGLALFEIWEAFPILPFTFILKAPEALNLNWS